LLDSHRLQHLPGPISFWQPITCVCSSPRVRQSGDSSVRDDAPVFDKASIFPVQAGERFHLGTEGKADPSALHPQGKTAGRFAQPRQNVDTGPAWSQLVWQRLASGTRPPTEIQASSQGTFAKIPQNDFTKLNGNDIAALKRRRHRRSGFSCSGIVRFSVTLRRSLGAGRRK
jgi:hypothetical protein